MLERERRLVDPWGESTGLSLAESRSYFWLCPISGMTGKNGLPGCKWDVETESAAKSLLPFMALLAALTMTLMHHPGSFQTFLIPSMILIDTAAIQAFGALTVLTACRSPMPFRRLKLLRNVISVAQPHFLPWEASGADSHACSAPVPRPLPTRPLQRGQSCPCSPRQLGKGRAKRNGCFPLCFFIFTPFFFFFSTPLLQTLGLVFGFKWCCAKGTVFLLWCSRNRMLQCFAKSLLLCTFFFHSQWGLKKTGEGKKKRKEQNDQFSYSENHFIRKTGI